MRALLIVILFFILILLLANIGGILVTDLALDSNIVGDVSRSIAQGSNEELIPKGGSVDAVVQQADRHVGPFLDGATNLFDGLGVGFGTLQETAVAAQNLVETVPSQVEETLSGVDNWIVGKRWVGDDKVLLGSLQGLDEGEIRVIEDLVGVHGGGGNEANFAVGELLAEQFIGLSGAKVRANRGTELLILVLEQIDTLLEGLEKELLADTRALGVFAIAFAVKGKE
jgi:hypothetical protein